MLTVDFDRLGLRPGDRVLDMGCGAGRHAFEMYRRGADVMAFDMDADELAGVRDLFIAMKEVGEAPAGAEADKRHDFYAGVRLSLAAMLVAPEFLFRFKRTEADPAHPGQRRLSAYDKASTLSFFLWNSTPDPELIRAAGAGEINTQAGLERQVNRLLASSRVAAGVRSFFADMLQLDGLTVLAKDTTLYPKFDAMVAQDRVSDSCVEMEVGQHEGREIGEALELQLGGSGLQRNVAVARAVELFALQAFQEGDGLGDAPLQLLEGLLGVLVLRHLDAGEPLHREAHAEVVRHRGQVVGAVRERDVLGVRALLGQLLHRAVEVTHHHVDVLDALAVHDDAQAEHAVGGRVLWPDVEDVRLACGRHRSCVPVSKGKWGRPGW